MHVLFGFFVSHESHSTCDIDDFGVVKEDISRTQSCTIATRVNCHSMIGILSDVLK